MFVESDVVSPEVNALITMVNKLAIERDHALAKNSWMRARVLWLECRC